MFTKIKYSVFIWASIDTIEWECSFKMIYNNFETATLDYCIVIVIFLLDLKVSFIKLILVGNLEFVNSIK